MKLGARTSRGIELATLALAAAILAWQLFVPPVIGLANNGDFHKVLGAFSLGAPIEDEYHFSPVTYTFAPSHYVRFGFYSTEQLLTLGAVALNALCNRTGTFDLRFIGLVHGALYLLALGLALPLLRDYGAVRRVLCSAGILFVFCDVMYVSELNSFYMDTPAFVFFLLSAVLLCRMLKWRRHGDAWGMVACLVLMIGSKAQHAPLGLVAATLLAVRRSVFLPGFSARARAAVVGALLAAVVLTMLSTPRDYAAGTLFSQVFYRILPQAKDPHAELAKLGLDDSYAKYTGLYFYQDGVPNNDPDFARAFLEHISYTRLGWYLLGHPGLTCRLVINGLAEAGRQRPLMGNFDRSTGVAPSTESHDFSLWSDLKSKVLNHHGGRYLAYTLALTAAFLVALFIRRARLPVGTLAAGCALAAMLFVELLIFTLGDALDFIRHGFVFAVLSETILVAGLIAGCVPRPE